MHAQDVHENVCLVDCCVFCLCPPPNWPLLRAKFCLASLFLCMIFPPTKTLVMCFKFFYRIFAVTKLQCVQICESSLAGLNLPFIPEKFDRIVMLTNMDHRALLCSVCCIFEFLLRTHECFDNIKIDVFTCEFGLFRSQVKNFETFFGPDFLETPKVLLRVPSFLQHPEDSSTERNLSSSAHNPLKKPSLALMLPSSVMHGRHGTMPSSRHP